MNPTGFQNPFEGIINQMNAARTQYEQTLAGLQAQMNAGRQALNSLQNPFAPMPQQPAQQPAPATPVPGATPTPAGTPEAVPPHIQQLSALGKIEEAIGKTNETQGKILEMLEKFMNGTPIAAKPETTQKGKGNETPKT